MEQHMCCVLLIGEGGGLLQWLMSISSAIFADAKPDSDWCTSNAIL